jgi:hypothetical protein
MNCDSPSPSVFQQQRIYWAVVAPTSDVDPIKVVMLMPRPAKVLHRKKPCASPMDVDCASWPVMAPVRIQNGAHGETRNTFFTKP